MVSQRTLYTVFFKEQIMLRCNSLCLHVHIRHKKQTSPEYLSQVVLILGGQIPEAHSAKLERHLPSGCSCSIDSNGRKSSSSHQNGYALTLSPGPLHNHVCQVLDLCSSCPTSRKTDHLNLENVSLEERKFWKTTRQCFSI